MIAKQDTRFDALDGWRGVCAVMVIFLHAPIAGPIGQLGFVRHSFLFVDFFFVLSGFVIAHAWGERLIVQKRWASFIQSRFWRVYPLHLAMLLVFLLFEVLRVRGIPSEGGSTPIALLHNALLTHSLGFVPSLGWNYPSWSISAEFVSYLVFAALAVWLPRQLLFLLPVIAFGGLAFLLARLGHIEAHVDFGWLRCLAGFALGAFLRLRLWDTLRIEVRTDRAARWTVAELATVAYVAAFVSLYGTSGVSVAAPLVFAAAIFVFAHEGGAISRALKTRPFALLGLLSYSIYMTHAFVIARLTNVGTLLEKRLGLSLFVDVSPDTKVMANNWAGEIAVLLVILVGTLILSAITWRLIEKPGQALGRNLAAHRPDARLAKPGTDAVQG
ncbi:acyltransferase [Aureimonas sp. AU20]|uniref:acyltransferase family protein n=1 Tax=Aureimonas sp. AU20 TaxID=1349819 RepID=UPI0007209F86|nr:acyltransferase [Aureimonas sp. AU20]ALN73671.1 hypothetical protein M673_13160 [Aureimonas sp. AU20]